MAESPNARRERIAEAIFVAMVGADPQLYGHLPDVLAATAREWADAFVAGAPKQPQPTPDGYPTLLEAAKNLLNAVDTLNGPDFFISPAMMRDVIEIAMLRDAIKREEGREHMRVVQSALDVAHLEEVEDELGGLRAEIRRLDGIIDDIEERAWKALGEPEGTYETTNVQRLCAEVERLRSRVGWLDHLDTPEGRAMHATEAVRVENEQVRAQRDEARAEVAAVDAAICDRGITERDCTLPVAKRVDNLILDLRAWSLSYVQTVMENEQLRAEVERMRDMLAKHKEKQ